MIEKLSDKEVKLLIAEAQQGDKDSLTSLYESFSYFRNGLVSDYFNKGISIDDIRQEVDYAFILSIYSYDFTKSDYPILHIVSRTRRIVANFYNKEMEYIKSTTPKSVIYPSEDLTSTIGVNEEYLDFSKEVASWTEVEKLVLYHYFILDKTQQETAEELGISRMKVQRVAAKIKKYGQFSEKVNKNAQIS